MQQNRFWFNFLLFLFVRLGVNDLQAQELMGQMPRIHADGSVTFIYENPDVKRVKLMCDCRLRKEKTSIRRENRHRIRMHCDSSGTWTFTTPPLAPEVYTYQFKVAGRLIPDPRNADSIKVHRQKRSVFTITGTPQADLYVANPIRGHVDTMLFQGNCDCATRRVLIYLPPAYDEEKATYPVLYLLHGINGNENVWKDRGRVPFIMDNLIAQNRVVPMIVIMPDANPNVLLKSKADAGMLKQILCYPAWSKREFERCFPQIDSMLTVHYRISCKQESRAVAGLSAGAKQAANLGRMYDGQFATIGLFSPVVNRWQLPKSQKMKFWIGAGSADIFHYQINHYRKKLQQRHVTYTMCPSVGGHTWRNWRIYFSEFVQTLFWPTQTLH